MEYNFGILGVVAPEMIIILAILLLMFGAKKLPELSRSLGSSVKELRKGMNDDVKSDKPNENKARSESAS